MIRVQPLCRDTCPRRSPRCTARCWGPASSSPSSPSAWSPGSSGQWHTCHTCRTWKYLEKILESFVWFQWKTGRCRNQSENEKLENQKKRTSHVIAQLWLIKFFLFCFFGRINLNIVIVYPGQAEYWFFLSRVDIQFMNGTPVSYKSFHSNVIVNNIMWIYWLICIFVLYNSEIQLFSSVRFVIDGE